ncbi:MAG: hypothetical protein HRU39_02720 [Salinicola sp.]|uniref:hypothetical protein n=1 Tax=Salinicola sp. TaxID=1978524 RepID=UPI001DFD206E|nr:hypothetical protein [Salinicola sp.]NRB54883.1 hypothetical protein [Salinicola sp.]
MRGALFVEMAVVGMVFIESVAANANGIDTDVIDIVFKLGYFCGQNNRIAIRPSRQGAMPCRSTSSTPIRPPA